MVIARFIGGTSRVASNNSNSREKFHIIFSGRFTCPSTALLRVTRKVARWWYLALWVPQLTVRNEPKNLRGGWRENVTEPAGRRRYRLSSQQRFVYG